MNPSSSLKYAILINTTDSFEDAWVPFFKLFEKYWHNCTQKIYLNTEKKHFSYPSLDIIPIKNSINLVNDSLTWSECLIKALDYIEEDYVLYMQEDYFLRDYVDDKLINELFELMCYEDLDCIHLTDQSTPGPFNKQIYDKLWEIKKNAEYRISCQAALWKKSDLKSHIKKHESPWYFEIYGSKRSKKYNHKIFVVNKNIYGIGKKEIIPYIFTGIKRGKWNKEVVDLFIRNNITVNYIKRGFYDRELDYNSHTFIRKLINLNLNKIKMKSLSLIDLYLK